MADKRTRKIIVPPQGGTLRNLVNRLKLIFRLMGDRRVSPWVKLIPLGAFVYLVSPVDLIMGIPGIDAVDDAAVIWIGSTLFVELCPQHVVQEHMEELAGEGGEGSGEVVDADVKDISDK